MGGAAAVVAALIVYGSLVPFDVRRPDEAGVRAILGQVRFEPWASVSRTDVVVNTLVGVPFGFFLLGAIAWSAPRGRALALLAVSAVSAALAMVVEVLQVYSVSRDSSWNDVGAQAFGAALGGLAWMLAGRRLVHWCRSLETEPSAHRLAGRLLCLYLPIYAFVQLTWSHAGVTDVGTLLRGGQPVLVPFTHELESAVFLLRNLIGSVLLAVPLGAFAILGSPARASRDRLVRALLAALSFVVLLDLAQSAIWSRPVSVRYMIAGGFGLVLGSVLAARWAAGRLEGIRVVERRAIRITCLTGALVWSGVLAAEQWWPFGFQSTRVAVERLADVPWVPFTAYHAYSSDPLQGVREMVRRGLAGVLLGLLLRSSWRGAGDERVRACRVGVTLAVAALVLSGIEVGQLFVPARYPDPADVLIGLIGVTIGSSAAAAAARRGFGFPARENRHRL